MTNNKHTNEKIPINRIILQSKDGLINIKIKIECKINDKQNKTTLVVCNQFGAKPTVHIKNKL